MISIVVPIYNEEKSLDGLLNQIIEVMDKMKVNYEVIWVNDGSTDNSQIIIDAMCQKLPKLVKSIEFRTNFGKAAALSAGFKSAQGDIIVTLDGDLQDNPVFIPFLIDKLNNNFDLVSGWKQNRQDAIIKNASSKLFNFTTRLFSGIKLHDFNCGFKAYRAEAVRNLQLYGELHRYIPIMVASQGYKVTEIAIKHRRRQFGKSKYGSLRFINGFFDLFTVLFITKFRMQPLHIFGYVGLFIFSLGLIEALYLTIIKFIYGQAIGGRPLLLMAAMSMIIGIQIGITGLLGEQITAGLNSRKTPYVIKKTVNVTDK